MKSMEMLCGALLVVVAMAVMAAGCSGGSPEEVSQEAAPPTVEPTVAATATPVAPVVGDEERVAAAVEALERDGLGDLIAWDVLESTVDGELVRLTLCGWTGETVFDEVIESRWLTEVVDGAIVARPAGSNPTSGECLNTELIDSALAFTREYDDFYRDVAAAPETFATDPRGRELYTDVHWANAARGFAQWASDGVTATVPQLDGRLPDSALAEIAYRRGSGAEQQLLDLVACRQLDRSYGLYANGERFADGRDGGAGEHAVTLYRLERLRLTETWQLASFDELIWGDCFRSGEFLDGVAVWLPEPPGWAVLR